MNQIFKRLPLEIVKDNIFSYLDTDTKMKLKYREIEKYDNITKELSNTNFRKFNHIYYRFFSKILKYESAIKWVNILFNKKFSKTRRIYIEEDYWLIYFMEKIVYRIEYKNNSYFLKFKTVKDLKQLCKMNNLKKYSKLKKNELIRLLLSI